MIHVPAFEQSNQSTCGPASVRMVLAYWGISVSEKELCTLCNHSYERGCTIGDMKHAFEVYDMNSKVKNLADFPDIQYYINRKIPVIVDWFTGGVNPGPGDMPNGHSSVVIGLDSDKIHVLDPENGEIRHINRLEFKRTWFDWEKSAHLEFPEQLILRQMLVAYPNSLEL